jgi:hypothetical protein
MSGDGGAQAGGAGDSKQKARSASTKNGVKAQRLHPQSTI